MATKATRRTWMAATLSAVALATAACTPPAAEQDADTSIPAATEAAAGMDELAALDAKELIAALEGTPIHERRDDLMASVQPDRVVLTTDDGQAEIPIPEDQHYLSIAPFVTSTHECYYHSLTTCTGELGGAEIALRIVDNQTGEVYIDQTAPLEDNGFTGVWLPTDITATVTITSDRGTGEAQISTGDDDLTCLTSLQLT